MPSIRILSGGAGQGLVSRLQDMFTERTGSDIDARFGAVGAMREIFLQDRAHDLLILTDRLIDELAASGDVDPASVRAIGRIPTSVAVRDGQPVPDIATADGLRDALHAATAIYFPDPTKATAGIHFMKVLRELGIADAVAGRLRPHPNGITAMRAMAADTSDSPIGCTQVTEILFADGVSLAGTLPPGFELVTTYAAGVPSQARNPRDAVHLRDLLIADDTARVRRECGID